MPRGREPNRLATTLRRLHEGPGGPKARTAGRRCGLMRWRSNDLIARFLPAGFLLQDVHWRRGWAWERLYEPLIRRGRGLGSGSRRSSAITQRPPETRATITRMWLVVGRGRPPGLCPPAPSSWGASGAAGDAHRPGTSCWVGGSLLDARLDCLAREPVRRACRPGHGCGCLPRTTVLGGPTATGVFGALRNALTRPRRPVSVACRERPADHPGAARGIRHWCARAA